MGTLRVENEIPVLDYLRLRESVGWVKPSMRMALNAVKKCFYSVCVYDDDKVIGMIRLIWIGDECAYIDDVVVDEDYRSRGIGSMMVKDVISTLKNNLEPGEEINLNVMSAPGRESFYEQFGFRRRSNKTSGSTLTMWIRKD